DLSVQAFVHSAWYPGGPWEKSRRAYSRWQQALRSPAADWRARAALPQAVDDQLGYRGCPRNRWDTDVVVEPPSLAWPANPSPAKRKPGPAEPRNSAAADPCRFGSQRFHQRAPSFTRGFPISAPGGTRSTSTELARLYRR